MPSDLVTEARPASVDALVVLHGAGIGRGLAVGPVLRMPEPLPELTHTVSVPTPAAELERASAALAATAADDPTLADDVEARTQNGLTAERAVFEAFAAFRDLLVSMGGYLRERATGSVTASPDARQVADAEAALAERLARPAAPPGAGRLADGTAVPLLANPGSADAALDAVAKDAEGDGLFRTESLFLDSSSAPTVTEQQEQYTKLLTAFAGKKVVVRALDAGADKPLSFLDDSAEANPALGLRGLRALRANEQILRDQLTALANAAAATEADLWVMAPMISTVEETRYFSPLGRELGLSTLGVMVEVPSAAFTALALAASSAFEARAAVLGATTRLTPATPIEHPANTPEQEGERP